MDQRTTRMLKTISHQIHQKNRSVGDASYIERWTPTARGWRVRFHIILCMLRLRKAKRRKSAARVVRVQRRAKMLNQQARR